MARQSRVIIGLDEEAGLTVDHEFNGPAEVSRNHGTGERHEFHQRIRYPFGVILDIRYQDADVANIHDGFYLVLFAEKEDAPRMLGRHHSPEDAVITLADAEKRNIIPLIQNV
jgi:hypothetical protein